MTEPGPADELGPSSVIDHRFRLLLPVASGFSATSVWKAIDTETDDPVVVKVFRRVAGETLATEYYAYLQSLQGKLAGKVLSNVVLPLSGGEEAGYEYQIFPFIASFDTLEPLIGRRQPIPLPVAFGIISEIARVLAELHDQNVIHADLKPSNILLTLGPPVSARLIDFGMIRPSSASDSFNLISTYRYLHPLLSDGHTSIVSEHVPYPVSAQMVGPYIDIYALGIIAIELISGRLPQKPVTETSIRITLLSNKDFMECSESGRSQICKLLCEVLSVTPGEGSISASTIAAASQSIARSFSASDEAHIATLTRGNVPDDPRRTEDATRGFEISNPYREVDASTATVRIRRIASQTYLKFPA